MANLAVPLGMPLARRIADVIGNTHRLHSTSPNASTLDDDQRRAGLIRMAFGTDLTVLHAVATATATSSTAVENVAWSGMVAEDAGLLAASGAPRTVAAFHAACREAFASLPSADAADRCWGEARELFAQGRVSSAEEAVAATWRWRDGDYPRLTHMVGISGSGKSTLVAALAKSPNTEVVSLDDLRAARGSRADQSANQEVLREAVQLTERLLADGTSVVWDATSLMRSQRKLVDRVAQRRNALIEHRVLILPADELALRNQKRDHPVPADVLAAQIRRYEPSYPGDAHRVSFFYSGSSSPAADGLAIDPTTDPTFDLALDEDSLLSSPWED
ncbi:AAA family ATPase [Catenulispora yoronensis]